MVSYGKVLLQFQCKYQLLCLLTQCYRHSNVSISYGLLWSSVTQALMQVSVIVSYDNCHTNSNVSICYGALR